MKRRDAGTTLIEVIIAISLLSVLAVAMLTAMRVGFNALEKTNARLLSNRRVTGAQRILEQQLEGLIPVIADSAAAGRVLFFQGEPQAMRFVTSYSIQEASRGYPQIAEFLVIPGEGGRGVRLIVNERRYGGPQSAGQLVLARGANGEGGGIVGQYAPIQAGPGSFVLADKLASCRFLYLAAAPRIRLKGWRDAWNIQGWPSAVRVEITTLDEDPSRLRPVSATAVLRINRDPTLEYGDY